MGMMMDDFGTYLPLALEELAATFEPIPMLANYDRIIAMYRAHTRFMCDGAD
jgi:hypothetical protein